MGFVRVKQAKVLHVPHVAFVVSELVERGEGRVKRYFSEFSAAVRRFESSCGAGFLCLCMVGF